MSDKDDRQPPSGDEEAVIATKPRAKTKRPSMYKVLMVNDDYTPMDFVVMALKRFFGKDHEEATKVMLEVHNKGLGLCGIYTYDVAETKASQVVDAARRNQHPLQCRIEKE